MTCEHNFHEHDFVEIVFPEAWYVIENEKCEISGAAELSPRAPAVNPAYSCVGNSAERSITIGSFKDSFTNAGEDISFTFNSVRNPSEGGKNYNILIKSFKKADELEAVIDVGTFVITNDQILRGDIQ